MLQIQLTAGWKLHALTAFDPRNGEVRTWQLAADAYLAETDKITFFAFLSSCCFQALRALLLSLQNFLTLVHGAK